MAGSSPRSGDYVSGLQSSSGLTPLMDRLRLLTPALSSHSQDDEHPSPVTPVTPLKVRLQRGRALPSQSEEGGKNNNSPAAASSKQAHNNSPAASSKHVHNSPGVSSKHAHTPPTKKPLSECATPPPVPRKRRLTKESLQQLQSHLDDAKFDAKDHQEERKTYDDGITSPASPP
ncbi:unnamed protein product, partial [Symbiodinium sp. CCMP2456]